MGNENRAKEGKVRYNSYLYRTLYPFVKMTLGGLRGERVMLGVISSS